MFPTQWAIKHSKPRRQWDHLLLSKMVLLREMVPNLARVLKIRQKIVFFFPNEFIVVGDCLTVPRLPEDTGCTIVFLRN